MQIRLGGLVLLGIAFGGGYYMGHKRATRRAYSS